MPKYLSLQIPSGCSEEWNNMLPDEKGKFCLSCQKKVIDFSAMSDRQLIDFFKKQNSAVCGRFTDDQLNRDILIPPKQIPWMKYFFMFTIPAFLLSIKSLAQRKPLSITGEVSIEKVETLGAVLAPIDTDEPSIGGLIEDEYKNPVPFASITVKGKKKTAVADSSGRFNLNGVSNKDTLIISSVGFEAKEVVLNEQQINYTIQLQLLPALGEVVVMGYCTNKKNTIMGGMVSMIKRTKTEFNTAPITSSSKQLQVYPNPAPRSSSITIEWKALDKGTYAISIYDLAGRNVYTEKLTIENGVNRKAISLPVMPAGTYFVRLANSKTGKERSVQFVVL